MVTAAGIMCFVRSTTLRMRGYGDIRIGVRRRGEGVGSVSGTEFRPFRGKLIYFSPASKAVALLAQISAVPSLLTFTVTSGVSVHIPTRLVVTKELFPHTVQGVPAPTTLMGHRNR